MEEKTKLTAPAVSEEPIDDSLFVKLDDSEKNSEFIALDIKTFFQQACFDRTDLSDDHGAWKHICSDLFTL